MSEKLTPVPARIFTRSDPCKRHHFVECFATEDGRFRPRAVVEARGIIGLLAIKYWIGKQWASAYTMRGVDYWELTTAGQQQLLDEIARQRAAEKNKVTATATRRTRTVTYSH